MSRHALIVSSQIEGLLGADGDAIRVAAALTARGFAVDLRQGESATRAGVLDGLAALTARCTGDDAAVFYYAGHGSRFVNPDPRAGDPEHPDVPRVGLFIAPTDYRASTDDDFRGISAWELAARLAALTRRTNNATVVLDCCHAAQMMRGGDGVGATARTLPWPHRLGVARYLDALRADGVDLGALDPLGNPDAVRLFACGEGQAAWERDTPVGRAGALTEAWLWALDQVGDGVVAWDVLGPAIRERVQRRFAAQRPELGGPVTRALFSTRVAPRTDMIALVREHGRDLVAAGTLVGTRVGDTFTVVPMVGRPGSIAGDATTDGVAIATVTEAGPLRSVVTFDRWTVVPPTLPDGAMAVPRTRQLATMPVRVTGDGPEAARLRARIASSPRLHLAEDVDDAPPVATIDLQGGEARAADDIGPLRPPTPLVAASRAMTDVAIDGWIELATDLGVARSLRALDGAVGLPLDAVAVTWGTVADGALAPRSSDGATITLADRIALRIDNRATTPLFVHVFDVGLRGRITRLTTSTTTGVPLAPGASFTLGAIEGHGLVGLALAWPDDLPRACPRHEELVVIATGSAVDLGVLESRQREARAALPATATGLQRLCAQLHVGGARGVAVQPGDGYALVRVGFWLDPGPTVG